MLKYYINFFEINIHSKNNICHQLYYNAFCACNLIKRFFDEPKTSHDENMISQ